MPLSKEHREAMREASRELAEYLGQIPARGDGIYRIASRTTPGSFYEIRVALDGQPICNCPAGMRGLICWHQRYVEEELTNVALRPVVLQPARAPLPTDTEMAMLNQAATLAISGAITLPRELNTQQKVAAVMLYGWELGLKPMTAIRHLYIVNGKVAPSCEVMAGLMMAAEPDSRLSVVELTDKVCTMRLQRPSRDLDETYTVTWDEIVKAGLDKGDMNSKYPRDRLRYHCTKRLLRIYAPDAINNMEGPAIEAGEAVQPSDADFYNEGDVIDVDLETGEVLGSPQAEPEAPASASSGTGGPSPAITPPVREPVAPVDLLNEIAKKYGAARATGARGMMPYLFGTGDLLKLTNDQRAIFAEMLRVWLNDPDHAHEQGYALDTRPVCRLCGIEWEEAAPAQQTLV